MISKSPQANNQAYTFLRNSLSQCSKSSKSKRAITPIKWSDETAAKICNSLYGKKQTWYVFRNSLLK